MTWQIQAARWLAQAAIGGTIVLALGSLAARLCRQPVRRARLAALTLACAAVVPWLGAVPIAPRWSAPWISAEVIADRVEAEVVRSMPSHGGGMATPPVRPVAIVPREIDPQIRNEANFAAHAASRPTPVTPAIDWSRFALPALLGLYAAATAGLVAWWLLGQAILWRTCRAARPVSDSIRDAFLAISGPKGSRVALLESDRIALPFTFTWRRPVILVPSALCGAGDAEELRYGLAHEWSHVERGDSRAWTLAAVAGFVLFYQPMFWWLRRQLRLCQDFLADDRASALGSPEDYASYLVRLASRRAEGALLPALGIGDRRSNLHRRIVMLVQDHAPLERHCRPIWTFSMAIAASAAMLLASGLRLDAAPAQAQDSPTPKAQETPATKATGETVSYTGLVADKETGQPIAGASVLVGRSLLPDPKTGEQRVLEETRHTTDAEGHYRFTISPEQAAEYSLYIWLEVKAPGHVGMYGGYSFGMIRKNEGLGERPFFEDIRLRPGTAIEGLVLTPEGGPAEGVKVSAFSTPSKKTDEFEFGTFSEGRTDASGRFSLELITPGPAAFWLLPERYAPSRHNLKEDKRGDLGTFRLAPGITFRGQVLDSRGTPVAGVYVGAHRERGDEEDDQDIGPVADHIARCTVTAADGSFALGPFPHGRYRVSPTENGWDPVTRVGVEDPARRPLPGVFTAQTLTLKDGEEAESVEFRAVPHVIVEAQAYNGQGVKRRSHEIDLFGKLDGESWYASVPCNPEGTYTFLAPHGLEDAQINMTTNEHSSLKYRLGHDGPLVAKSRIDLGTLDHDVRGIEIVRYVAPVLLVKGTTKDGEPISGVHVSAKFTDKKGSSEGGGFVLPGGISSDVSFERQGDGRFRSSQLHPDREVTVKAQAEGFEPATKTLTLPEGKTEEVVLVLEKK